MKRLYCWLQRKKFCISFSIELFDCSLECEEGFHLWDIDILSFEFIWRYVGRNEDTFWLRTSLFRLEHNYQTGWEFDLLFLSPFFRLGRFLYNSLTQSEGTRQVSRD